jgi:sodium/pantothenate symporter
VTGFASSEMMTATWGLILVYAAITIFLVVRGARRIRSMNDYAVGNVIFSPAAVGLALAAAMTSAATFIINPGFIALYGVSAMLSFGIIFPAAALVSLVILTKRFRKHGTHVSAQTLAQWIGTRYASPAFRLFFAFLSLLLITFITLICVGLTKVLAPALNLEELTMLISIVVFVFGYMMFGGANSMVYTNAVQATIMLVVAFILLGSGYPHFSDGVRGFLAKLEAIDPALIATTNARSFLFRDYVEIVLAQIVVGVAVICQPHIITKSLLLKHDRDVNRYLLWGIAAQGIFFLVVFTGFYARLTFPDLIVNGVPLKMDGIIPAYVVREFPVYVGVLVVLGLLSAGISTLEGLIQSLSTTITADIIKPLFGTLLPEEDGRRTKIEFIINRLVIVAMAVVAILLSRDQLIHPKLSVGIFAQNGVYAYFAAAFVPIVFGMFVRNTSTTAAIAGAVTAVMVHFIMYYGNVRIPFSLASGENPGVAAATAIVAAVLVAGIASRFSPVRNTQHQ